jgi:hypothetical protein
MKIHDKIAVAVKSSPGRTLSTRQRSGRSYCLCSGKPSQIFAHDGAGYKVLDAEVLLGRTSRSNTSTPGEMAVMGRAVVTTWNTITLENAKYAVKIYNEGLYGCVKNPDLDNQAREMFSNGLGFTREQIGRQVEFIGRDYGGAAGFKAAYALAPDITRDIFANRKQYEKAALSALPILTQILSRDTIEVLYRPFVKPLHGKEQLAGVGYQVLAFSESRCLPH